VCAQCSKPFGDDGFFEKDDGTKICPDCVPKQPAKGQNAAPKPSHPVHHGHDHGKHGHDHDHGKGHDHDHGKHGNDDGCRNCEKPIPKNKKKKGHDCDQYCDPCEKDHCCATCHDEINGPAVSAFGNQYHPDCFNCHNCHNNIAKLGGKYQQKDGEPFCNPCFDKLYGKNGPCAGCGQKLDKTGVEALGQKWHPQCFNCTNCHCGFPNGDYIDYEGKPYCEKCAPNAHPDHCYACKKALSGQVTKVLGNFWHQGCFACVGCGVAFHPNYTVFQGLPYCEPCNIKLSADRCEGCGKPMAGEVVVKASGKQWHKACFRCATCKKDLSNPAQQPDFFIKFSKPYCRTCSTGSGSGGKYCTKCGTANDEGNFCFKCGNRL